MRNKKISLKYNKMKHLFDDMDYLVKLGFADFVPDPKTGEYGWTINPQGLKLLENMRDAEETTA